MASFEPRAPFTPQELSQLYPPSLSLQQVQVVLRHGERSPVSPRFQNTGLTPYWPYCTSAKQLKSIIMTSPDASKWDVLQWRRKLETIRHNDTPVSARGPSGEQDTVCLPGETTDKGRETTHALGERLRHLYVDQLHFMPTTLTSTSDLYLRATPIPRALDAVQQAFSGMYSSSARSPTLEPPTIHLRIESEENLFDNDHNCKRYHLLYKAFADRAASKWNKTPEMAYVNSKIGKWMPAGNERGVQIDSRPRLSGIMDTVNATLAHGPATRLPKEFYDEKFRQNVDKMVTDEWFAGYSESEEFRRLGKGQMAGDMTQRLIESALGRPHTVSGASDSNTEPLRFTMTGAHDTTLAGFLTAFGAFDGENWPRFTSHIAVELFKSKGPLERAMPQQLARDTAAPAAPRSSWFTSLFSSFPGRLNHANASVSAMDASPHRLPSASFSPAEREAFQNHYVRIRYNDRAMVIPSCRKPGRHFEWTDEQGVKREDESLCTLQAFKDVADAFTPSDWKRECKERLDEPVVIGRPQLAGWPAGEGPEN